MTHRLRAPQLLATLLTSASLGACSYLPSTTPSEAPVERTRAGAPIDPTHAFLATASDGDARAIMDPVTGSVTEVTAGASYFAASGRKCRHYTAKRRPAPARAMLACRVEHGGWQSRPSLLDEHRGEVPPNG